MPEVIFNGPEGRLEGRFTQNKKTGAPIAMILHPLPQLGGNMNNPVAYQLYHQFVDRGFSVLRFNFRGVGASQGISGKTTDEEKSAAPYAPPEVGDLLAVTRWLANEHNAPAPLCAGYSFGAHVLWHALSRTRQSGQSRRTGRESRCRLAPLGRCRKRHYRPHGELRLNVQI